MRGLPPLFLTDWETLFFLEYCFLFVDTHRINIRAVTGCVWCGMTGNWGFLWCNCGLESINREKVRCPAVLGQQWGRTAPAPVIAEETELQELPCSTGESKLNRALFDFILQSPWFHNFPLTVSFCCCHYSQVSLGIWAWMVTIG